MMNIVLLVLFELDESKTMFWGLIPYNPEVLVPQSRAANKLQAGCRSNGLHGIYTCAPAILGESEPGSVQLTNSANSTSDNERSISTRANKDGYNPANAQHPTVVV